MTIDEAVRVLVREFPGAQDIRIEPSQTTPGRWIVRARKSAPDDPNAEALVFHRVDAEK